MIIKPLKTKSYDRRASGDCGTSGLGMQHTEAFFFTCKKYQYFSIVHFTSVTLEFQSYNQTSVSERTYFNYNGLIYLDACILYILHGEL